MCALACCLGLQLRAAVASVVLLWHNNNNEKLCVAPRTQTLEIANLLAHRCPFPFDAAHRLRSAALKRVSLTKKRDRESGVVKHKAASFIPVLSRTHTLFHAFAGTPLSLFPPFLLLWLVRSLQCPQRARMRASARCSVALLHLLPVTFLPTHEVDQSDQVSAVIARLFDAAVRRGI